MIIIVHNYTDKCKIIQKQMKYKNNNLVAKAEIDNVVRGNVWTNGRFFAF